MTAPPSWPTPSRRRRFPLAEAQLPPAAAAAAGAKANEAAAERARAGALLQDAADAALWIRHGEAQRLQISLRASLFDNVRCSIGLTANGIEAVFLAEDAATYRLLAAEGGRLERALAARGLKASAVRVVRSEAELARLDTTSPGDVDPAALPPFWLNLPPP